MKLKSAVITIIFFIFLGGCSDTEEPKIQDKNLDEASMNFDMNNVKPFLQRISPLVESGFSTKEINQVQENLEKMEPDDEYEVGRFDIVYRDKKTPIIIKAFMDSPEAPDVYIFTEPDLANQIQEEMIKFADELEAGN
ncbi:hypothetical protein J7E79_29100 [Bacillus sp. ISL-40]|uniref:hypothetical protein n=1 Tax=unclassified Bacillus (in: firmicutes) TaxID=185979 RepID=UPI001BE8B20A|nr:MULTISPECIES: hypothetical protein [unclassified Bacillus (in: firmicutes)]MBT2701316.1 hypothetical protein [Bacillus sp. ISL-40]MBT2744594.1 hypothetical protein [Bacillus sp. ISL-77]